MMASPQFDMRTILSGRKIIDLTQIGAGPTCTMLLGDFGAEITKIEPVKGDISRTLGPPWYGSESPVHIAFNRGKRSLSIDLKSEDGAAIVRELVSSADFLVESFRPGTLRKFGLDFETVHNVNPGLIYCSVSGYGQNGPFGHHAGVDGIMQAASGLMGLMGTPGSGPIKIQAPVVDVFTGYVAALGCVTALADRLMTGVGRYLDINLFSSAIALQQSALTSYLGTGEEPTKLGSAAPYSAPNEAYPTQDGWIMIAAYMPNRWPNFCDVIERPELVDDPRFATPSARVENRAFLFEIVSQALATRTTNSWLSRLEARDILCSRIADYGDVLAHAQTRFNNLIADVSHPDIGALRTPGNPINPRDMNGAAFAPPPQLGEHSRQILRDLGKDEVEIEHLITQGVVSAREDSGTKSE